MRFPSGGTRSFVFDGVTWSTGPICATVWLSSDRSGDFRLNLILCWTHSSTTVKVILHAHTLTNSLYHSLYYTHKQTNNHTPYDNLLIKLLMFYWFSKALQVTSWECVTRWPKGNLVEGWRRKHNSPDPHEIIYWNVDHYCTGTRFIVN